MLRKSFICNSIDGDLQAEGGSRKYQEVSVGKRDGILSSPGDSSMSDLGEKNIFNMFLFFHHMIRVG